MTVEPLGKTLAFLIPVLECLYRQQWSAVDGLGALIVSPTRELAYQTFEVLRKVGRNHEFSAGLVIGGKDLETESQNIHRTNIIICTPGGPANSHYLIIGHTRVK